MLTKKTQCQLTADVMTPPATRPTAAPAKATRLKIPNALACSAGEGNRETIMARTTAELAAPPTPWLGAKPQAAEPAVKITSPARKTRLALHRSASRPASSRRPAKATGSR